MIVVEHVAGLATVQDLGRPGRMHEGLAPGGALVPEMLIAANRAVGNLDPAPAIELLGRIRLRVETPVALAFGATVYCFHLWTASAEQTWWKISASVFTFAVILLICLPIIQKQVRHKLVPKLRG